MAPGGGGQIPQGYQQNQTGPGQQQQQQYTTAAPTAGYQQAPPNTAPVSGGSMYNPYNMHGKHGLFSSITYCVIDNRVVLPGHFLVKGEQLSFFLERDSNHYFIA